MNHYEILFSLNPTTQIIAKLKDPLSYIGWDDAEPIVLMHNNTSIHLAHHPIYFNIKDLRDMLQKALNNELHLHPSITADIGYLENGQDYNKLGFITENPNNQYAFWIGYRYMVWQAYNGEKKYTTWLYNNKHRSIILEITPAYPYWHCEIKKEKHYIPFKKWILRYKPYFIQEVSREIAQQWLEHAEYTVKTIDENIKRWREKEKIQKNYTP